MRLKALCYNLLAPCLHRLPPPPLPLMFNATGSRRLSLRFPANGVRLVKGFFTGLDHGEAPPPSILLVLLPPEERERERERTHSLSLSLSFALQVVALCVSALPAVEARQRLAVFVHTPAVAPPPAFGWAALDREEKKRGIGGE